MALVASLQSTLNAVHHVQREFLHRQADFDTVMRYLVVLVGARAVRQMTFVAQLPPVDLEEPVWVGILTPSGREFRITLGTLCVAEACYCSHEDLDEMRWAFLENGFIPNEGFP